MQCLTKEELDPLKHPLPLTKLERQWKILHDKLKHIPFSYMDILVKHNILPQKFSKFKGQSILCTLCMFGQMKKRASRTKGIKNLKYIKKSKENYPGAIVSTDQLVVAQPALVPKLSGRHSHLRIFGATGFIDHHSGYSFSSM